MHCNGVPNVTLRVERVTYSTCQCSVQNCEVRPFFLNLRPTPFAFTMVISDLLLSTLTYYSPTFDLRPPPLIYSPPSLTDSPLSNFSHLVRLLSPLTHFSQISPATLDFERLTSPPRVMTNLANLLSDFSYFCLTSLTFGRLFWPLAGFSIPRDLPFGLAGDYAESLFFISTVVCVEFLLSVVP